MSNDLTRRSFVKWGTAAAGAATLAGFTGCAPSGQEDLSETGGKSADAAPEEEKGVWLTGACMNNCSCNSSRCLLKVYVEDGIPLKIRTDEEDEDAAKSLQRRACPRGRSQVSNYLSPARVKYPMKRKSWSPEQPNGELRGIDEWERISWDEALGYVADELKKCLETYGNKAILTSGYSGTFGITYYDQVMTLIEYLGGGVNYFGTVSWGSWAQPEMFMTGLLTQAPDGFGLQKSDLHVLFGFNWSANRAGNTSYQLNMAREKGSKVIVIDPWLNQTAQALADEWIPIIPGTDTAFIVGMAYHQIENNLQAQDYLDKYCVGFDAEHMPDGADPKENFKDYVLGTYDSEPKTPEWAEAICGVPAAKIRETAEQIASAKNVNFYGALSSTKIQAGEMMAQAFYTFALMHGGLGKEGNYASWQGQEEVAGGKSYVTAGDAKNGKGLNPPPDPLMPPKLITMPNFAQIEDNEAWECLDVSEYWQSIVDGEYGRDAWPGGKRKVDIHLIYAGGYANFLNQYPNTNAAIKAYRKADFVFADQPFFNPSAQYCDIVLPAATWWEKYDGIAWSLAHDSLYCTDKIMEPLYEAKPESWIAEQLAEKMGVDTHAGNTMTDEERRYYSLKGATYLADAQTMTYEPLFTITQEDIDEMGVEGEPQEGLVTVAEVREKGVFKMPRSEGDGLSTVPFADYIADPEANPLNTSTGKFEIYCPGLAAQINSLGFSSIYPIAKWQADEGQGQGAQTDEYPLLLWTPHSLRRMHSNNDNVISLREAFPQECFMSVVDAEARGIKNGDPVLMTSPYGKVLRPAKVLPTIVPGAVALQDGAWARIDPETGIDLGGCPNILQAPKASGQGVQAWTGTIVQVEKYDGSLTLDPDKNTPIVMPVGIEE